MRNTEKKTEVSFSLYTTEREFRQKGYRIICGVDEVGRGPLAGPVYACAAILPDGYELPGLNDSKKLSEKRREALYEQLIKDIVYAIGEASPEEIDTVNILGATYLAMERAVEGLPVEPDLILIDGNRVPPGLSDRCCETVVGGDAKVAAIAAASIIAKVSRDRLMAGLSGPYEVYEFPKHKGYGTKLHYEKLFQYGISDIHRKSFLTNLEEKRVAYERTKRDN